MALRDYIRVFYHDWRTPKDLKSSIRFVLILGLMGGMTPYYISITPEREMRESPFAKINMVVRMLFYQFCFGYSLITSDSILLFFFDDKVSFMTDTIQKLDAIFGLFMLLVISLFKRKLLLKLMVKLSKLETKFFNLGISFSHRHYARRINLFMAFLMCINNAYVTSSVFAMVWLLDLQPSVMAIITFFSPHFHNVVNCTIYFSFIYLIKIYMRALNKVLKNLSKQWDKSTVAGKALSQKQRSMQFLDSFSIYRIVSKSPTEIVQESMEVHHLICEAATTANKYFTYQLLTIISISFLIIVFDAYYVLETVLGKTKRESKFKTVEFVTFFSCQMVLYLIAIVSIVEGSSRAIKKSEKTGGIVHALLHKAPTAEVKEKLQQFSMQLMHMKINFTAGGLFSIDRTLYFTISGALTTYLIILLQFTSNSPHFSSGGQQQNSSHCIECSL